VVKKQGKIMLGHMNRQSLDTLIHLLEEVRGGGE
jgi:hypothetical protein